MGFLNQFSDTLKSEVKPKSSIRGMIKDAEEIGKIKISKKGPSVLPGVTKAEYLKRYNGVLITLYINIIALIVCGSQFFISSSLFGKTLCAILFSMCLMYYFRYAFLAWRARVVFSEWASRNENKVFYYSDFIEAIQANLKNILPLKLNNKKGDGNESS